ncbi:MAG: helix-turn-helix domain-containing protein [Verrucomicrobia bacterium]|nr:helix-turn-helix domain-containing protein [Verrucomicrobiota bacterium]
MPRDIVFFDPLCSPGDSRISAGEFRQGPRYSTTRPKGRGDYLLLATVAGSGLLESGEIRRETKPGTVVLFEPNSPQHYQTHPGCTQWHLLWAHFQCRPTWMAWLDWPSPARGLRVAEIPEGEARTNCWRALRRVRQSRVLAGASSEDFALNALETALLWIRESLAREGRFLFDPRIRRALDIMGSDLSSPFSVAGLARACGLSPSRLTHLFRNQVGVSPQRFSERCRLNRAAELLRHGGMPVGGIAQEVGFGNAFYFSNRFRKAFGKSPRDFAKAPV